MPLKLLTGFARHHSGPVEVLLTIANGFPLPKASHNRQLHMKLVLDPLVLLNMISSYIFNPFLGIVFLFYL